jgi:uncharacterized protein YecT (DUF1311 family)
VEQRKAKGMKKIIAIVLLSASFAGVRVCHGQTQLEMNQAALLDLKKTENELTEVYQKVIQRYSKGSEADLVLVDRLRKAQRAWIKFRDAHIEAIFPSEADRRFSARPMCVAIVLTELDKARITQLREWLDGVEEGDVCHGTRPWKVSH